MSTHLTIPVDANGNIISDTAVEGVIRSLERKGWTPGGGGGGTSALSGPGRPDVPSTTQGVILGDEPLGTTYTCTDEEPPQGLRVSRKVADGVWHPVEAYGVWAAEASQIVSDETGLYKKIPDATGAITVTLTPSFAQVQAVMMLPEPVPAGTALRVDTSTGPSIESVTTAAVGEAQVYAPEFGRHVLVLDTAFHSTGSSVTLGTLSVEVQTQLATITLPLRPTPWPLEFPDLG